MVVVAKAATAVAAGSGKRAHETLRRKKRAKKKGGSAGQSEERHECSWSRTNTRTSNCCTKLRDGNFFATEQSQQLSLEGQNRTMGICKSKEKQPKAPKGSGTTKAVEPAAAGKKPDDAPAATAQGDKMICTRALVLFACVAPFFASLAFRHASACARRVPGLRHRGHGARLVASLLRPAPRAACVLGSHGSTLCWRPALATSASFPLPRVGGSAGLRAQVQTVQGFFFFFFLVSSPTPTAVDKETARHEDVKDYYEFGREIGRGGFSVVVEGAKKGTTERYAIKCIKKSNVERDDIKLLRREIQIMKAVDHPNILKLFEVFESEEEFFLVMELVDGKELFDKIVERGQYSEKDAANIVRQIISAVEYLHERGIAHRYGRACVSCAAVSSPPW